MISRNRSACLLLLLLLAYVSVAADTLEGEAEFKDDTGTDPLIGSDVDELISHLGRPDKIFTLPTGKRAFAYDGSQHTHQRQDGSRCADAYVVDSDNMVVDYFCR